MSVQGTYLGMPMAIDDLDVENLAYFKHCAAHNFHLQRCTKCQHTWVPQTKVDLRHCPKCRSDRVTKA